MQNFLLLCSRRLIKKKTKFSSYIRKSRRERLHIILTASSYMTKHLRISSYIRKPFFTYYFATAPSEFPYFCTKFSFLFLSVQNWVETGFIPIAKGWTSRDSILWSHWAPNDQTVSDRSLIVSASANACFMSSHFSVPSDHQHFRTRTYRFFTMLTNTRL